MIKWLTGLATIAALASFPGVVDDVGTRPPSPGSASTEPPGSGSASTEQLPRTAEPAIGGNRTFSMAEIRWCMSQHVRLEAAQTRLATRRAVDRYNELAGDYNRRCNGYRYRGNDEAGARGDVERARPLIVAAALEDFERLSGGEALTRRTQELLELLGYNPGVIDGAYGAQTRAALEAFQREAGIPVDGLLSEQLLEQLVDTLATRATVRYGREDAASTVEVVIVVTEGTREPVADAQVSVSGDREFQDDRVTDERGRVELAAVPAGKLDIAVRRSGGRFRYTSQLQVSEEPRQEVSIILPTTN